MLNKTFIINCLHRLYRTDKWVNELFNSAGIKLDQVEKYIDEVYGNNFFDTATENGLRAFEEEAGLTANLGQERTSREGSLKAKWTGAGTATLKLLQSIADSWKNGLIELTFVGGKLHVEFTSPVGVPSDLYALKEALENVKPAHLAIYYSFRYVYWYEVKAGTYNNGQTTWNSYKNNFDSWDDIKYNHI